MKKIFYLGLAISLAFTACNDDDNKYYKLPSNPGGTMELQGGAGGAQAENSVYVDFSTGKQASIKRNLWDLGLYCGKEFGVRLNNTLGSRATEATANTALGTVLSQEQHDEYAIQLAPSMGAGDFTTADRIDSDTDLSGTVVKKGKVYIYRSGDDGNKEIYKVSVAQKSATTYTISYARWNSTEIKTLDVDKDDNADFVGVSFDANKQVDIRPAKAKWDIVWGRTTYTSAMAAGVPFMISDVVFLNTLSGVGALELLAANAGTYDEFTAEKAAAIQFSYDINVIGSGWRNGGGPNAAPAVKSDRFYVIKDAQGNIYKLGFVSMNDGVDGGRRGYPEIKYALLTETN